MIVSCGDTAALAQTKNRSDLFKQGFPHYKSTIKRLATSLLSHVLLEFFTCLGSIFSGLSTNSHLAVVVPTHSELIKQLKFSANPVPREPDCSK